ncbi:DUF3265 domain-containing protein [Vibrio parahaemolyticus]|nr:DUF3265 domain-containing protein [Vibrio parahaemolyticus]
MLVVTHNNLFKSDSQRLAFFYALRFVFKVACGSNRYCVAHTLTGRYVPNPVYVTWAVKFQISYEIGCI